MALRLVALEALLVGVLQHSNIPSPRPDYVNLQIPILALGHLALESLLFGVPQHTSRVIHHISHVTLYAQNDLAGGAVACPTAGTVAYNSAQLTGCSFTSPEEISKQSWEFAARGCLIQGCLQLGKGGF